MQKPIKKVTFLQPPALITYGASKTVWPPLGILYLITSLEDHGYDVSFVDSIYNGFYDYTPYSEELHILGTAPEQSANDISSTAPDMLCVSLQFENQVKLTMEIVRLVKAADPDCFILLGGPIVTLKPETTIKMPCIDGVLLGEAEESLPAYIHNLNRGWKNGMKGAGICRDGKIELDVDFRSAPTLDDLNFPARHRIDMQGYIDAIQTFKYLPREKQATTILSTRGCPERCCFCASNVLYKRRYRLRSAENVCAEIEHLIENYGIDELLFFDENWSASRKRTIELLDMLIERNYGIKWHCSQGFGIWTMDDEIIEKMKVSGCYKIKFSIESGSQRVLDNIVHKRVDLSTCESIVQKCKDVGLITGANFIVGFPEETIEEMHMTYELAKKLDVDFTIFNVAMPYPQTELCERAKELGYLPPDYEFDALKPGLGHMNLPHISNEKLQEFYHQWWLECNFSTKEKEARYQAYVNQNPDYKPTEKGAELNKHSV
jgi:magnesium-protoporphyrin IX monomethyl ester (oxidative) cyclase